MSQDIIFCDYRELAGA